MKHIPTFAFLLAATMSTLAPRLVAQQSLEAKVPFAFSVADQMLPAGEYRIDHNGAFLHLEKRGADYRSVVLLATPGEPSADGKSFLSFDEVNGVFTLQRVITPFAASSLSLERPQTIGANVREVGMGRGR